MNTVKIILIVAGMLISVTAPVHAQVERDSLQALLRQAILGSDTAALALDTIDSTSQVVQPTTRAEALTARELIEGIATRAMPVGLAERAAWLEQLTGELGVSLEAETDSSATEGAESIDDAQDDREVEEGLSTSRTRGEALPPEAYTDSHRPMVRLTEAEVMATVLELVAQMDARLLRLEDVAGTLTESEVARAEALRAHVIRVLSALRSEAAAEDAGGR